MTMLRYNAGKAPLSLIPTSFFEAIFNLSYEKGIERMPTKLLWQVGQVLDFGAKKYSAHNWRKGGSWSSVLNSGFRHLLKMIEGEQNDPESGLAHAGHLGCNIAFLLEFATTMVGDDDLFKVPDYAMMPSLESEPAPGLIWVFNSLLKFRDGNNIDDLREAAYELARFVEIDAEPETSVPAAPPQLDNVQLPFKFPEWVSHATIQ